MSGPNLLHSLLSSILCIAPGCAVWWLVRRNSLLMAVPGWVRFCVGLAAALLPGAVATAFFEAWLAAAGVLEDLPGNLLIGYCFAEILHCNNPATWARLRRIRKRIEIGDPLYWPDLWKTDT